MQIRPLWLFRLLNADSDAARLQGDGLELISGGRTVRMPCADAQLRLRRRGLWTDLEVTGTGTSATLHGCAPWKAAHYA
jgi:hypothetical protein